LNHLDSLTDLRWSLSERNRGCMSQVLLFMLFHAVDVRVSYGYYAIKVGRVGCKELSGLPAYARGNWSSKDIYVG